MDQSILGDLSSNQQSSAERKKLKIKLKQDNMVIDQTDFEQKHIIQSQSGYDQALEQRSKPSVTQVQQIQQLLEEKQSEKQVQQFDQDFGQQQLDKDSSSICYQKCENKIQLFQQQPTVIKPRFGKQDYKLFSLHKSEFNVNYSRFEKGFWIRILCHNERQVYGISDRDISMDDMFNLLLISSHIGISTRSNKLKEEQNIIKIDIKTFKSSQKDIYQQLFHIMNGLTPEGKSWSESGSSRLQLKIVGEIVNKQIAEFIIGGYSEEQNIFLTEVKDEVVTKTIPYGCNKIRSIWLKINK